jgi:hypothetical protein
MIIIWLITFLFDSEPALHVPLLPMSTHFATNLNSNCTHDLIQLACVPLQAPPPVLRVRALRPIARSSRQRMVLPAMHALGSATRGSSLRKWMLAALRWRGACLAPMRRRAPCTQGPGRRKGAGSARGSACRVTFGPRFLRNFVHHAGLGLTRMQQAKFRTLTLSSENVPVVDGGFNRLRHKVR